MTKQEMIQRIAGYCKAGLLEGVEVCTTYCETAYCAKNIRIDVDGCAVLFDQSWGENYRYANEHCNFMDHVREYVFSVLCEIEKIIKIDKNLF